MWCSKIEVVKKNVCDELVKKVNAIQTTDTSDLVEIAENDTKNEYIEKKIPNHCKYTATNDFNKFSGIVFDERLKEAKTATNKDLGTDEQRATETENNIEKLQSFDFS